MWTWGSGSHGQPGHNNQENRLVPTSLAGETLVGAAAVLVVTGNRHKVAVTHEGELWVWRFGPG